MSPVTVTIGSCITWAAAAWCRALITRTSRFLRRYASSGVARSKCSRCFGITSLEEGPAAEESAAESLNSSSSSSSAREPAPKKKRKKAAEYCVLLHALWRDPRSGSPNALAIALFTRSFEACFPGPRFKSWRHLITLGAQYRVCCSLSDSGPTEVLVFWPDSNDRFTVSIEHARDSCYCLLPRDPRFIRGW